MQVAVDDIDLILYVDCTKLGVISQSEVNHIGETAERLMCRNPTRQGLICYFISHEFQTSFFLSPKIIRKRHHHL